jgi:hypothetical protein
MKLQQKNIPLLINLMRSINIIIQFTDYNQYIGAQK